MGALSSEQLAALSAAQLLCLSEETLKGLSKTQQAMLADMRAIRDEGGLIRHWAPAKLAKLTAVQVRGKNHTRRPKPQPQRAWVL